VRITLRRLSCEGQGRGEWSDAPISEEMSKITSCHQELGGGWHRSEPSGRKHTDVTQIWISSLRTGTQYIFVVLNHSVPGALLQKL
jgi:hypothetical protein